MAHSKESLSTAAGPVPIDVYSPTLAGTRPSVLILHGTLGLQGSVGADIASFAESLNKVNIAAAIPSYFKSTNTAAGEEAFNSMLEHLPAWKGACGAALAFMTADARFDSTRIGLIGFSLGGHIALSLAMERTGIHVKSVVDFFAPTLTPQLRGDVSTLPPLLIHHGASDPLTIENSRHLVRELAAKGRRVTPLIFGASPPAAAGGDLFIEYPGESHGFHGAALAGSRDATIRFLRTHLK
jgi:dienelactone hydrolase